MDQYRSIIRVQEHALPDKIKILKGYHASISVVARIGLALHGEVFQRPVPGLLIVPVDVGLSVWLPEVHFIRMRKIQGEQ